MESRIPIPTDNIYKFYALFGLLLFVFGFGSGIYYIQTSNEKIFTLVPELAKLKTAQDPTLEEKARIQVIETRLELGRKDKPVFHYGTAFIATGGVALMYFGFTKWHKLIQPIQDRTASAQAEIAELQAIKLRRELGLPDKPEPQTQTAESSAADKLIDWLIEQSRPGHKAGPDKII